MAGRASLREVLWARILNAIGGIEVILNGSQIRKFCNFSAWVLSAVVSSAVATSSQPHTVIGVDENDVLNIRADIDYTQEIGSSEVVGAIPHDASDVFVTGVSVEVKGAMWREVEYQGTVGWVNSRFLKPTSLYLETPEALLCGGTEPFWDLEINEAGGAYMSPEVEEPIQLEYQQFAQGAGRTDLWAHYMGSTDGTQNFTSYQWIYQLTFFLGFQSLRISESPHSSIEKERVMGAAVKIERKDMSARELRRLAGGVKDGRVSRRLLAIALVLEGASRKVAAESCGMDRQILCDWVHRYNAEGVDGLSDRLGGGVKPLLTADQMEQLAAWVEAGPDLERDGVVRWRRADLARRIEAEFGIKLHERTVGTYLAKLGFRRMSVRPHHPKADPQAQTAFKKNFERLVAEGLPERAKGKPLEIWFQDEARVGQQGTLTRIWAKRGTRPRAPRDTRYKWSYIFGAACPERGAAAGLILPYVNTEAMELHLAEIAKTVAGNAHALLIVDGAGWHGAKNLKLPDNITLLKLPPYSPELNPMENVWQYLRANKLAITVFDTYEDILDKCSDAWNFFAGDQERITSITYREWATVK